jgi:hypothetical protein
MVESCIGPRARGVTLGAGLREIRTHVVRIRSALKVLQVTGNARRVCQCEVVIGVAIGTGARRNGVRSGQWEIGQVMVEGGV